MFQESPPARYKPVLFDLSFQQHVLKDILLHSHSMLNLVLQIYITYWESDTLDFHRISRKKTSMFKNNQVPVVLGGGIRTTASENNL